MKYTKYFAKAIFCNLKIHELLLNELENEDGISCQPECINNKHCDYGCCLFIITNMEHLNVISSIDSTR